MHFGFSVISFSILLTWPAVVHYTATNDFIFYLLLVFLGISSGFLRTNHLSLLSLLVPKKSIS
jgi:hypothetical protein